MKLAQLGWSLALEKVPAPQEEHSRSLLALPVLPAASLTLIRVFGVAGPGGRRELPFAAFPAGYMLPSLAPDEMVTEREYR